MRGTVLKLRRQLTDWLQQAGRSRMALRVSQQQDQAPGDVVALPPDNSLEADGVSATPEAEDEVHDTSPFMRHEQSFTRRAWGGGGDQQVGPVRDSHLEDHESWDSRKMKIQREQARHGCGPRCKAGDDADEVDHNEVLCPQYHLIQLFRVVLMPQLVVPMLTMFCIFNGLAFMGVAVWGQRKASVPQETKTLLWVSGMCAVAVTIPAAYALDGTRYAIMQSGPLSYLGAGQTMISRNARKALDRWAKFYSGMVVFFMFSGTFTLTQPFHYEQPSFCKATGACDSWDIALAFQAVTRGLVIGPVAAAACPGLLSLHVAAALSRDAIAEAMASIRKLKQVSPSSLNEEARGRLFRSQSSCPEQEWTRVESLTLRLATDTMPCLSAGWARIALGMWGVGWIGGLLSFAEGVTGRWRPLVAAAVAAITPMLIALPLADTSTKCAELMDHLNMQRTLNLNLHDRLSVLETALRQSNKGKGLGFVVANMVIDSRMIAQALLGVISIMSTVIPLVIVLRATESTECVLNDLQVRAHRT